MKTNFFNKTLFTAVMSPLFTVVLTMVTYQAVAQTPDEVVVESTLKRQWDKPDNPLQVLPIVVVNQYAIAGWVQGERGGRALLRRAHRGWEVFMCGGDDLAKPQILTQAGVDDVSAAMLANRLKQAELRLSPSEREQFSVFKGVVPVEAHQHHVH